MEDKAEVKKTTIEENDEEIAILKQKIQAIEGSKSADITKHNLDVKTEEELTQMDETEQVAFAQEI